MLVFGSVLGVVAFVVTTRLAYANLAEAVDTRVREVAAQIDDLPEDATDLVATDVASPVAVQIVAADGRVLAHSPGLRADLRLCADPDGYLTASTQVATTANGPVALCAGASLAPVARVQASVLVALAIMLPVALVGVGLAVWFAVGRALASVEDLRRQAEAMSGVRDGNLTVQATGDEVERLGRTLNAMIDHLHTQARTTQQFVADAGHELRNPLTTLRVALEFADGPMEGRELALAELSRLDELVADLLVLARSDAREAPARAPVDVADVVRAAVVAAQARRADVDVVADLTPVQIVVDERSVRSAVDNLLANAVRHARTRVDVRLTGTAGCADLAVDDDGCGLAVEDCERVFGRFVRLDEARDRDEGGSGLGLAIVAAVAAANGGRAWAEPRPGGHFRLSIPIAAR